ncbi:HD superfamily phosphohydrolase [Lysinibacillus composti]|uniref:HD domain-containing protein n=1 Tax=Lysinibacillus composti TaxID=720633 RepID=A0A3N9UHI6_9BACI|nr:HD domain-containing protein [Lysinibacillus composti]MBM7608984.1 HD superfamily phosphohydrolase [Lysinibacillus composti]RQW75593.1 HD domain-containing protein [Lysinibacillus composti]
MQNYGKAKLVEEKVFKDPVHRYIHVRDQVIWDLISTKEFQRLRRVRQLGTTYLVFHGAEHSRFNHSLGVYEIVRRIVDDIFSGRPDWDENERLVVLCAALLHDLGHGPFSHAFENVFHTDHEYYTRQILLGNTEVNDVLNRVSEGFPEKVAQVIEKTYPNETVVSLISSQIDADRMDYLQRDAYYTGVSYGHFDMERILRVMRPRKNKVVIKASGMHAVEDYIMSRYQMYLQVYFHPVSRSAEVVLNHILKRVKQLSIEGYQFAVEPTHFKPFFKGQISLEDYLSLDEYILYTYFQSWMKEKDPILSDLCSRFVNRNLFKYANLNPEEDPEKFNQIKNLLVEAGMDPDYYLYHDCTSDLPYDFYRPGEESTRIPIFLEKPNGEIRELSQESLVVDAIAGRIKTDHKVYYPKELLNRGKGSHIKQELLEALRSK